MPFCDFHEEEGHATATCPEFLELKGRRGAGEQQPPARIVEMTGVGEEDRCVDRSDVGDRGGIGVIHGGVGIEATRKASLHTMYRRGVASTSQAPPPDEKITFSRKDLPDHEDPFCDALVIRTAIEGFTVSRILVDNGSSVNVIFKKTFNEMRVEARRVLAADGPLFGFSGERKEVEGGVGLQVTLGGMSRNCRFVIVDAPSSYNAIFGRPLISAFRCVPSSFHQCLKLNSGGTQIRVRGDPKAARECYVTAVNTISWRGDAEELERRLEREEQEESRVEEWGGGIAEEPVMAGELRVGGEGKEERGRKRKIGKMEESVLGGGPVRVEERFVEKVDMAVEKKEGGEQELGNQEEGLGEEEEIPKDQEEEEEPSRLKAAVELQEVDILTKEGRKEKIRISGELGLEDQEEIRKCVQENIDIFAWSAADMPGIDADVACHRLNLDPKVRPIQQKKRAIASRMAKPIREEVEKLLQAGFISANKYPGWVSNVVMVKKGEGKWRMCIDFSLLNKACPKDCYPLPRIDALVDSAVGFSLMSFLDAFSGYHQIRMHPPDIKDVTFITEDGCFSYNMMPFGLKNAGETYQRMMDRIFREQKGRNLEVYVDDLMIKSQDLKSHIADLEETFATVRKYKMRLNPLKCVFEASRGKFLGHLLTPSGVEPNPDKVRAILELESPANAKEVQRLTGKLAGLSRFLSRAGERCSPFFRTLRGGKKFEWTSECENAFLALKQQLTKAPLLQGPREGEILFLYLGVGAGAVSSVLVREEGKKQFPIYYVSRVLKKAELKYPILEKLAFALVISARKLRPYFQAHSIQIVTDHPLRRILEGVEHSGRLAKWSIELSEFDLSYVPRLAIKAQAVADFLVDYTVEVKEAETSPVGAWEMLVDGASGKNSFGGGMVLVSPEGTRIEQALKVHFILTNNQAEYEAIIAGLRLARELGIQDIKVSTDSMIVARHIKGEFEVREPTLQLYLTKVKRIIGQFRSFSVQHVPREENTRADLLAKHGPRAGGTMTKLFRPSIEEGELMEVDQQGSWMDPFTTYLTTGRLPEGELEKKQVRYKSAYYLLKEGILYRKTLSGLLARCISEKEVGRVLEEIHSGECGSHSGSRTLEGRVLRQGYFWPTLRRDAEEFSKKCRKCQEFAPLQLLPAQRLRTITAPWPFAIWGLDLVGPFPQASGQRRFLLVMVDYFSKWLEVKALAKVTSQVVKSFVWGEIFCRHGLPLAIVTDNGPQFASREFVDFCIRLGIDLRFASVHHPRSNGQAEAANKVIVNLLKKKVENLRGSWVEQLPSVLWALRTTPSSATGETPFKLSHGSEAVIPVEFEVESPRVTAARRGDEEWLVDNGEEQRLSLDLVEELRELASIRQEEVKRRMSRYFDKHVRVKQFEKGDLVLKKVDAAGRGASVGKLNPNWEGPFIVKEVLKSGGYHLQDVNGTPLDRARSGDDLKRFYP
ncbi:hypothetical protein KSP39_PZI014383 [Platanthera zijinensis]|uniref:Uncharacterized protein n=1 Tax=Platanthera zijinensis TaxID=2320716 RepID=A0AAP0BAZ1_9ASPA